MDENVLMILYAIAPEFAETPDDTLGVFTAMAKAMINESAFGDKSDLALAYYVAHLLTMRNVTASEGASSPLATGASVTMEREDTLQRQYSTPSVSSQDKMLATTYYGQMYLELRKTCIVPVLTRLGV